MGELMFLTVAGTAFAAAVLFWVWSGYGIQSLKNDSHPREARHPVSVHVSGAHRSWRLHAFAAVCNGVPVWPAFGAQGAGMDAGIAQPPCRTQFGVAVLWWCGHWAGRNRTAGIAGLGYYDFAARRSRAGGVVDRLVRAMGGFGAHGATVAAVRRCGRDSGFCGVNAYRRVYVWHLHLRSAGHVDTTISLPKSPNQICSTLGPGFMQQPTPCLVYLTLASDLSSSVFVMYHTTVKAQRCLREQRVGAANITPGARSG